MAAVTDSSTAPTLAASMACPTCGANVDYDRRFAPWCSTCDWNVDAGADRKARPPSRLQQRRTALARRLAEGSIAQVTNRVVDRPPRVTGGTVTLWLASTAIILLWLAMLVFGIVIVTAGTGIVFTVIGIVLVVVAFVSRPRLQPGPKHALTRRDAPALYELVDAIATALGAPRVAVIGVDGGWNAYTFRFGVRQRTAIVIGLPYWHARTPQERVALLGHEVAHSVNGDTTRGIVQATAELMLRHWAFMTEPDSLLDESDDLGGILSLPGNVLMLGASKVFTGVAEALFALAFPTRLRAELYADRLAATVAGRDAAVSEHVVAYHGPAFERALAGVTVRRPPAADLYEELIRQIAATPPSEIERLRRRERRQPFAFDQTHPPTPIRESLVASLPDSRQPLVLATPAQMAAIDAELAVARPAVTRELITDYRDSVLS
jgi:Zn-dependent protease with chaperone function